MNVFILRFVLLIVFLLCGNVQQICAQLATTKLNSKEQSYDDTLTATEAAKQVGSKVLVKAKVVGIHTAKNAKGKPTFIDLDVPFPNNPLSIIIFEQNIAKFAPLETYKNKTILIEGLVRRRVYKYRGKERVRSQIELKRPTSLTIVE